MRRSNGGIIGPDNVTTGGFNGVASGVFKLGEVTDLIRQSKWPEPSPFTNTVPNSVRFNSGSSDYLTKSFSTTGNRQKFTLSMWFKRGVVPTGNQSGTERMLFQAYQDSSNQDQIWLQSNGTINYVRNNANAVTPSQVLSDPNAWYHVVFAGDTTQGSNADRLKVYVNGTQAPIAQGDTIAQNSNFGAINNAQSYTFGKRNSNDWYFDGYMGNIEMVDGQQYGPEYFGSFNADSGIWTPVATSSIAAYGTNGFKLAFANAGALGTDTSGRGNTFTPNNLTSIDQTTDSPSNNFSTLNSLEYSGGGKTFSEGNTKQFLTGVSNFTRSSIGVAKGKWYCEVKLISGTRAMYGISSYLSNAASNYIGELGNTTVGYSYGIIGNTGRLYHAGSSTANWVSTFANSNIIMLAMDLDNYKLYFGKNGTWERSGDPTSGSTGTGAYTIVAPSLSVTGFYHFAFGCNSTGEDNTSEMNFGNPPFALSSAVTDGNGFGNFEYTVPTGYLSLCTNNLNILE